MKTNKYGDELAAIHLEILKESRDKFAQWAKEQRLSQPKAFELLVEGLGSPD